jgi:hypothetical protein
MVQIIAPQEPPNASSSLPLPPSHDGNVDRLVLGDHSTVDSSEITQSAVRGVMPPKLSAEDSQDATLESEQSVDEAGRTLPPPTQATVSVNAASGTSVTEADEYRRQIDGVWQSESTQRKKQIVLVAMLSLFGLITAGVVFSQFVRTWRQQQAMSQAANEPPQDAPLQAESSPADSLEPVDAPNVPSVADPAPPQETPPADDVNTEVVAPATTPPADSTQAPALQMSPSPTPIDAPNPSVVPPLETGVIVGDRATDSGKPVAGDQPEPPPMNDLPPGLSKFLPMANLLTSGNDTAEAIQPPPTIDTVRIEEAAMAPEPEADPAASRKVVDVEKALAQRFAIDNQGVSLADLMLVISSLTTVPIELELIAFDVAGIRVDTPIKTPPGWMSSKQWLESTCADLGLVSTTTDNRIMISVNESKLDSELARAFSLDDFGDQSREVFAWIAPLISEVNESAAMQREDDASNDEAADGPPVNPDQVTLSEDGQTIVPGASLRSKMHALFAIESARVIRGMPPKLEAWRTARWMGPWSDKHTPEDATTIGDWPIVSGGKAVPALQAPQAAASLLRSIASLNEAKLFVGWYDATRLGFFPADPMMPYSRDNSAGAVLQEMLGEPGLQTRICGPSLWYVCSEASYDRFEVFAWYTIPAGSGEAVRQRLANSLSVEPSTLPVVFTDTTFLVRCPRYLARQMPRIIGP